MFRTLRNGIIYGNTWYQNKILTCKSFPFKNALKKILPLLQGNSLTIMSLVKGASACTNINLTLLLLNIQLI